MVTDSALRSSRLARSLHFVSGFVCPTPRRWQRIIHSPQSQDLDSQTQTEQCRSSLAGGKCDIQKIATSSHRVSRFGIERASIRGRESSRLLIGARLEMLMPHLKYIKAANLRGRCEDRVGERGGRWCALPPQIWRLSLCPRERGRWDRGRCGRRPMRDGFCKEETVKALQNRDWFSTVSVSAEWVTKLILRSLDE